MYLNENLYGGRFPITGHLCCEMVESPAKGFRGFLIAWKRIHYIHHFPKPSANLTPRCRAITLTKLPSGYQINPYWRAGNVYIFLTSASTLRHLQLTWCRYCSLCIYNSLPHDIASRTIVTMIPLPVFKLTKDTLYGRGIGCLLSVHCRKVARYIKYFTANTLSIPRVHLT